VRLQNWFQFAWGVCQIGFCSRDGHVVPKKEDKFNKKLGEYDECVIFCTTVLFVDVFNVWGSIQN